jgi:hypothetical protein
MNSISLNLIKFIVVVKITGGVFFNNLYCQQLYEPIYGDPLNEPWRWTKFDELTDKGVKCISESADGKIIFGLNKGAVIYDGILWQEQNNNNGFTDESVN